MLPLPPFQPARPGRRSSTLVGIAVSLCLAAAAGTPAQATAPATAQKGGSVLQLGLFQKEGEAWWAWQQLQRRGPDIARSLTPSVVTLDAKRQGGGVALRAAMTVSGDAATLCRRIVGAGLNCVLVDKEGAEPPPATATATAARPAPPPTPTTATAMAARPAPASPPPPAMAARPAPAPPPAAPPPASSGTRTEVIAQPKPTATPAPAAIPAAISAPAPAPAPAPASAPAVIPVAMTTPPVPAAGAPASPPLPTEGIIYYNQDDASTLIEIEKRSRRRGRLGSVVPDTDMDVMPALLTKRGWNLCALTFDDGPHRTVTRQILDILNQEKIRATYFPIGNAASKHGDVIRDFVASGHEIGNHSFTHSDLRAMPSEAQRFEIAETNRILRGFGANPVLFRPPYGRYTLELLANTRKEHMSPVLWNVDTRDWQVRDPDKIVQHVKTDAGTGSVILLHSTYASTATALPRVIATLRAKGCEFVTLSEWIASMRNLAPPQMVNAAEPVVSARAPISTAQQ